MWWVAELFALQLASSIIAAGPAWRRRLALVVALGTLAVPWQVPRELHLLRACVALVAGCSLGRVIDLTVVRTRVPLVQRVWHVFAVLDTWRLRYAKPALDARSLVGAIGYGALAAVAAWLCLGVAPSFDGAPRELVRLGGGAVLMYAVIDAGYAVIALVTRAMGIVVYELHRAPILSKTVQELWGARWARTVSLWLFERTFKPLARRGMPRLGVVLSFVASGLLHAYCMLAALGWGAAGMWGLFFVVQGLVVLIERVLGVARWPAVTMRVWTVTVMLATSPLMVVPALHLLD